MHWLSSVRCLQSSPSLSLCGVILADAMAQRGVDEEAESSYSTFTSLMHREHPLVLRRAAGSWGAQPFLEVHLVFKFLAEYVRRSVCASSVFSCLLRTPS